MAPNFCSLIYHIYLLIAWWIFPVLPVRYGSVKTRPGNSWWSPRVHLYSISTAFLLELGLLIRCRYPCALKTESSIYIYIDIDMEGTALRKRCHTNDDFKNLFPWVFPWISQFANRKKSPFGPCWVALVVCKPVRKKTESESARGHRLHGSYSVFCTSHIPKAAGNIAPKNQKLSSHAGKMALDKPNIALQELKIKKPPHRVNAYLPLGLYVDAKKNVLVLVHLARNSRIWPYSPPRSQHSPPSGPIRL